MSIRAIDIRILGKKRTGDETVFFELTREVLRQDHENTYLLLTNEDNVEKLRVLRQRLGLSDDHTQRSIVTLPASNRFWWNLVVLPLFLWRHKVDVFHTQYILPFWVPTRTKVINHIHDVSFCALPEFIGKKDLFFLKLLIPRSLRRSTFIVTPSQFTKDEVIKYYRISPEKIVVIHNALGSHFLEEIDTVVSDEALRAKYALPRRFFLYVGTLQPRKNIPFLIKGFARYHEGDRESSLVLVGNKQGHHYDTLIDQMLVESQVSECVIFPGYIEEGDLARIMALAEVFIFPSLYEGFGIPLLEAMSQGVPVLASDIPVLHEVGGEAALYFSPFDVDSLVQKLYALRDSVAPKEHLIRQGRERIKEFSWAQSGAKLLALYQSSLEETKVSQ